MILSKIILQNFRKFANKEDGTPGLTINFHKGLNALIGENDAGKSTIIDAIKIVLQTQSGEYIRVSDSDFHVRSDGTCENEFVIDCEFVDFDINEAKNFIEWLTFIKDEETGSIRYNLSLHYRAWRENGRIYSDLKAGNADDGVSLDGKARDLLKCVYLRPLRDAEKEMHSGRNSRISQILYNHPLFTNKEDNALVKLLIQANENIENYFLEQDGKEILGKIRDTLQEFLDTNNSNKASLKTSDMKLKAILESLSLVAPEIHPGLGVHNLLFIAAELLLLNHDSNGGIKLALIEELEAHLHPQAQLRLINYLQKEYNDSGVQVIISTHSPILASKINIKNVILMKNFNAFDLSPGRTKLAKGDYLFLQRFLDSTKANLFFAKGIIMVEGDAENLFIPTLADLLGYNLEKHGISIVNVGNIGFFRYSNIFVRSNGSTIDIPVSIVTDCDVKPEKENGTINERTDDTIKAIEEIQQKYNIGQIRAFVAPNWTFEYSVALSSLRDMLYASILEAKKIENSDQYALTEEKIEDVEKTVNDKKNIWHEYSNQEIAYEIYNDTMLNKSDPTSNKKGTSKAIVAQCLSSNLRWSIANTGELTKEKMFDLDLYQTYINEEKRSILKTQIEHDAYLKYLVDAIKHAAGTES